MLRVAIEIVPFGDETLKREIGTLTLGRTELAGDCDYKAVYQALPYRPAGVRDVASCSFTVRNHPHKDGAEALVARALVDLLAEDARLKREADARALAAGEQVVERRKGLLARLAE